MALGDEDHRLLPFLAHLVLARRLNASSPAPPGRLYRPEQAARNDGLMMI